MRYAVNSSLMRLLDQTTIEKLGIPSLVLMERAALEVANIVMGIAKKEDRILIACGFGNNGGDGIAIARILYMKDYQVEICLVGDRSRISRETKQQLDIAEKLGLSFRSETSFAEYNIIVDSIFGIGLSKAVQGEHARIIQEINEQKNKSTIIAVDVPSGISADDGQILGIAVKADLTVTFQEMKLGLLLYPGAEYAGKIHIVDIGILSYKKMNHTKQECFCYYEKEDVLGLFPKRMSYSNKGTYGKVLIIAGSEQMTGAAYLSAYAAYRMGVGLVKVLTAKAAIPVLHQLLPEAIVQAYDGDDWKEVLKNSMDFADSVVFGPGIGDNKQSWILFDEVIALLKKDEYGKKAVVLDADALNILSEKMNAEAVKKSERSTYIATQLPVRSILTPHLKEFERLSLETVNNIPTILIDIIREYNYNNELIYVLKDTRTIVSSRNLRYINTSGNHAMATGGSGDVLTGIIAALLARKLGIEEAATLGVYLHGLAGDAAKNRLGANSVLARDIIEALPEVLMNYDGE